MASIANCENIIKMKNEHIIISTLANDKIFECFTQWLFSVLEEKRGMLTLALSGGNTPKALFDYWIKNHRNNVSWERVLFFWGDERCVPPTDNESNYKAAKEHLLEPLGIPKNHIFRIRGENIPEEEAKRYAEVLERELSHVDGMPSFDILMLGMGDDGHTASIFPHEIDLWKHDASCVVGTHPSSGQKRVSISGRTINAARRIVFLVTGEAKKEKVQQIIEHPGESQKKYPAALVKPVDGELFWFLDEAAAASLHL